VPGGTAARRVAVVLPAAIARELNRLIEGG
jgi:hypothetical protein